MKQALEHLLSPGNAVPVKLAVLALVALVVAACGFGEPTSEPTPRPRIKLPTPTPRPGLREWKQHVEQAVRYHFGSEDVKCQWLDYPTDEVLLFSYCETFAGGLFVGATNAVLSAGRQLLFDHRFLKRQGSRLRVEICIGGPETEYRCERVTVSEEEAVWFMLDPFELWLEAKLAYERERGR